LHPKPKEQQKITGKCDLPKRPIAILVEQPSKDPPIDKLDPIVECNDDDTTHEIVNEQQMDVHVPISPNVEHDTPENIVETEKEQHMHAANEHQVATTNINEKEIVTEGSLTKSGTSFHFPLENVIDIVEQNDIDTE
jgi:hypothetical protein